MREQWGFEEEMKDALWNSKAFKKKSRRQQNLEIYQVKIFAHTDIKSDFVSLYSDARLYCAFYQ